VRRIYPVVMTATASGTNRLSDEQAGTIAESVVEGRTANPGG
jgi:proteasome beta subunit